MAFNDSFTPIKLDELIDLTARKHEQGYRFVQMLCTVAEGGIDLVYSFMKRDDDGTFQLENYVIAGFDRETQTVPSVTGYYLSAFPFENEAHDLFGVKVEGNAIDFAGRFYQVAMDTPMTVISPEQQAAREKAARIAAAKAAKEAKDKAAAAGKAPAQAPADAAPAKAASSAADIEAERAALEEKLAGMDPEKAVKVRAAFEAKMKKRVAEAAQAAESAAAGGAPAAGDGTGSSAPAGTGASDASAAPVSGEGAVPPASDDAAKRAAIEEKLAGLDPEKAARVRAAMEAKAAREAAQKGGE